MRKQLIAAKPILLMLSEQTRRKYDTVRGNGSRVAYVGIYNAVTKLEVIKLPPGYMRQHIELYDKKEVLKAIPRQYPSDREFRGGFEDAVREFRRIIENTKALDIVYPGLEVKRIPTINLDDYGRTTDTCESGIVTFVHPQGRFHTVRFACGVSESYPGVSYEQKQYVANVITPEPPKKKIDPAPKEAVILKNPDPYKGIKKCGDKYKATYWMGHSNETLYGFDSLDEAYSAKLKAECAFLRRKTDEIIENAKKQSCIHRTKSGYKLTVHILKQQYSFGALPSFEVARDTLKNVRLMAIDYYENHNGMEYLPMLMARKGNTDPMRFIKRGADKWLLRMGDGVIVDRIKRSYDDLAECIRERDRLEAELYV